MLRIIKDNMKILLQRLFALCARRLNVAEGPALVIAPHPDDETLGCGAVIARLRQAKQPVRIIIVTDGSAAGHSVVITPEQIAATRRAEATEAAGILGVARDDIVFLDFPDGRVETRMDAMEAALGKQIQALAPRLIFSPYIVDRHPDHRAVAAAVDKLCRAGTITCPVYEYPIWFWSFGALVHLLQPHKLFRLRRVSTKGFLAFKKAAIAAHRSQYDAPTGEAGWFTFPSGFLALFLAPFEVFFEKPRRKN